MSAIQDRVAVAQARFIANRSPQQLAWLERRPIRRIILGALPLALPLMFSRKAARGVAGVQPSGVVELKIRRPGDDGVDAFEVTVADGRCKVRRGPSPRPRASISIGLADMARMGSGSVDPALFLAEGIAAGRIELKGDVFLFLAFPNLFRMPNRKLI